MDMTFPPGCAPNEGIIRTSYMGEPSKLKLPSPRHLAKMIIENGKDCYLSCVDLRNAYKQIPLEPQDWIYTGLEFDGKYYIENSIPFGAPHSAGIMHNTLMAVLFILYELGVQCIAYIDDEASVNPVYQSAIVDFVITLVLYKILGLEIAANKLILPKQQIVWLGVHFDTTKMTMSLPKEKMNSIVQLCTQFQSAQNITRKNLRSLAGKLLHVTQVLPQLRLFLNRILLVLRQDGNNLQVSQDMRDDLLWLT
jgi:hypothetical protein